MILAFAAEAELEKDRRTANSLRFVSDCQPTNTKLQHDNLPQLIRQLKEGLIQQGYFRELVVNIGD